MVPRFSRAGAVLASAFTYQAVSDLPTGKLPSDHEATVVRWTMTGILGSNYSFLE